MNKHLSVHVGVVLFDIQPYRWWIPCSPWPDRWWHSDPWQKKPEVRWKVISFLTKFPIILRLESMRHWLLSCDDMWWSWLSFFLCRSNDSTNYLSDGNNSQSNDCSIYVHDVHSVNQLIIQVCKIHIARWWYFEVQTIILQQAQITSHDPHDGDGQVNRRWNTQTPLVWPAW